MTLYMTRSEPKSSASIIANVTKDAGTGIVPIPAHPVMSGSDANAAVAVHDRIRPTLLNWSQRESLLLSLPIMGEPFTNVQDTIGTCHCTNNDNKTRNMPEDQILRICDS